MAASQEYSALENNDEKSIVLDFFFIGGIAITVATQICLSLKMELNSLKKNENNNGYYKSAILSAILCALTMIMIYILKLFCMNDLMISWNYASHLPFVTTIDSVIVALYGISKLAFYFGFTFHVQSIFYANNNGEILSFGMKVWMVFVAVISIGIMCIIIIADASVVSENEIGVTEPHNVYITMFLFRKEADIARNMAILPVVLDMVYFIVLMYLYVSKLRRLRIQDRNGAKGFLLLFISCCVMWICGTTFGLDLSIKYIASGLDILTDNICLFLMFHSGDSIYNFLCGRCCHNCCSRMLYGAHYKVIEFTVDGAVKDEDQEEFAGGASEALI